MKKLNLLIFTLAFFSTSFGQAKTYKKARALGVSFILNDFETAADIRANGLKSVLKENKLFDAQRIHPGMAVNYLSGVSEHVDFIASFEGSFLNYPIKNKPDNNSNTLLLEATANLNLKLLTDRYWVTPYIDLGVGASKYKNYYAAFAPVGLGLQINFLREAFVLINSQYRIPVTENASYHFTHSIGVVGNIKEKKEAPKVVEIPQITDRD
ncbi:MAG: hypothetical protein ABIO76_09365, partial [Ginsengibacter sp.]